MADDIAIDYSTGNRSKNKKVIKKNKIKIKNNLCMLGFDLETFKTEYVEYRYKKMKNNKEKEFSKIGKEKIKINKKAKVLGLKISSNMKFEELCEIEREKDRKARNLLHYMYGIYRGKHEVIETEYWTVSNEFNVEVEIGKIRRKGGTNDEEKSDKRKIQFKRKSSLRVL